jgi:hypothetical protein
MTAYSTGLQSGFLTINDVRRLEDLRIISDPSADTVRVPLANVNVEASTINQQDKRVSMAAKLVQVGYKPEEVLSALGLPEIGHTGIPSTQLGQNTNLTRPESFINLHPTELFLAGTGVRPSGIVTIDLLTYIDLFITGTARGITIGPATSSNLNYYGYFSGYGKSGAPYLTISYVK